MPFRRDSRPNPDQIEVIIGARATFSGQLRCDGSIRIDGTDEGGLIETPATVLITDSARVVVDIKARTVSVAGAYRGTITADREAGAPGSRLVGIDAVGVVTQRYDELVGRIDLRDKSRSVRRDVDPKLCHGLNGPGVYAGGQDTLHLLHQTPDANIVSTRALILA